MDRKTRSVASKITELVFAGVLMTLLLAGLYPNLRSPALGATLFWSLAVLLPTAAIAFGCLRRQPVASLVGWTILLLETTLIVHQ
jgi:hypothetical protein